MSESKEELNSAFKDLSQDPDFKPFDLSKIELTTSDIKTKTTHKNKNKQKVIDFKSSYNALELFNLETLNIPKLLDPFLLKSGVAALVGTSDTGKSTFLRQLSLNIALKSKTFLNFELKCTHNKVIYVTTEDDYNSISFSIRKQIKELKKIDTNLDINHLKNLEFIFDFDDLHKLLSKKLENNPVDLIVIDAFTDVFSKELNANTQVRKFLNSYSNLAHKHECLILFLHHIGKKTQSRTPSKDSIIGSQAFESKMRVVLELRPNFHKPNFIDLWVLKSNFLQNQHKQHSYVLELDNNMIFKNTGLRTSKSIDSKANNPELIHKILELHQQKLSVRKIESELENTEFEIGKSSIHSIIKKHSKH